MNYTSLVNNYTNKYVFGRYVTLKNITPFLEDLNQNFKVEDRGKSVEDRSIKTVTWGVGSTRIFMWSQMHGNESTTTKGVLDFLLMLNENTESFIRDWHSKFTFLIVPILNPDGAHNYTRVNANQVDLNRDSIDLSQPESRLLRKLFDDFKPDYAFNLHDQRTIFGVGDTGKPATLSFLAPSYNEEREINANRLEAIKLIAEINKELQEVIPGQVGRFDDGFNMNCIGDYFQSQGVPTILFEAGHYPNDYDREISRKLVFRSLIVAVYALYQGNYVNNSLDSYLNVPENEKNFNDVSIEYVKCKETREEYIVKIQYLEQLEKECVKFYPIIVDILKKESKFVHHAIKRELFFKDNLINVSEVINKELTDYVEIDSVMVSELLKK
ncbi:M14 family metallopeptidase [Myroides sp. M-43]|uniref:M14 family metallopeptidase n=1 Tax=Myroides oncorhynchi TaxID=2893756 RepID=UPI001E369DB3|nr:M14 metallopeptidase family protein [Myroides oncorhynchi]MCC9043771.1 M14 family metallopeptidase [Myroides oncorhynchi]